MQLFFCVTWRTSKLRATLWNQVLLTGRHHECWPGRIDHNIGIMVKTPKPIIMAILGAILGPKNYRFELQDPALVCGDYIYKY
jgi:hypothetical protein